jgi:hypothetical protein
MPIIGESPFLGLTPWLIYWLVAGSSDTWVCGGVCALLAAVLLGVSIGRGAPKTLDVVTLVFFAAVTIAGSVVGAADRNWLDTYAMTLSSGVLAVVVLGSLSIAPFIGPPFTWQYTRTFVAPRMWRQPAFESTDRVLTLMWCLVFTDIAILGFVSATALSISNWITCAISLALIVAAARVTRRVPSGSVAVPAPWTTRRDRLSPIPQVPRLPARNWKPIDRSASPVLGRSYAPGPAGGGAVHRIPPAGGENPRHMLPTG